MFLPTRILITGMAGFIASNVCCDMVSNYKDINFVGLDKITYCSDKRNFEEIDSASNFTFVQGDLCDLEFVEDLFQKHNFDTVMHFAAYSHVDYSFEKPLEFTTNNIVATHILADVARKHNIKRFIHISTDEVYGSQKEGLSTEESALDPTNPYSATKAAAEYIIRSYVSSYGFPAIITRGNNVFGPKQYPEKVIPRFILRLLKGNHCQIQGTGNQLRSFLYVDDVSRAFQKILFEGKVGEIYNIGSEEEYPILDIAKVLIGIIHPKVEADTMINYIPDRNFNDQRYWISSQKLRNLGWKPEITFEEGLSRTLDWYKEHRHWYSADV